MDKYWKASCLISAASTIGISVGLIGPFVYQDIAKYEVLKATHVACLLAGRGFGSLLGTLLSTYFLAKSNQSLWMCASLLVLASSIAIIPWSASLIILTLAIAAQGMVTSVIRSCILNLLRLYHGLASIGGMVQKLMHLAFALGCFLTLLLMILFANASSYAHADLTNKGVSLNSSRGGLKDAQPGYKRIIFKRSLEEDRNVTVNFTTSLVMAEPDKEFHSESNESVTYSTSLMTSSIKLALNFNSSTALLTGNKTEPSANPSNDSSDVTTPSLSTSSTTTTPVPMKPQVLDSNNQNHHRDAADGKIINKDLKNELDKNPLNAPHDEVATPVISSNLTTLSASSTSLLKNDTVLNITSPNATALNDSLSNTPVISKSLEVSEQTAASKNNRTSKLSHNGNSSLVQDSSGNVDVINDNNTHMITTVLAQDFSVSVNDSKESTPASPIATRSSLREEDDNSTKTISGTFSLLRLPEISVGSPTSTTPLTQTSFETLSSFTTMASTTDMKNPSSSSEAKSITDIKTDTFVSKSTTTIGCTIFPSTTYQMDAMTLSIVSTSKSSIQEQRLVVTQLESLYGFLRSLAWDLSSPVSGYYILSMIVFVMSGILALNSGLCWKARMCRSYPEVSYTCSEKDSLPFRSSVYVRFTIIIFHWSYNSMEVLIAGLMASYMASFPGVTLHVGIAATCLFWFSFSLGRLIFVPLSLLSRSFHLTFLTTFLTLICLIAFLCMLHISSSLPWYFFACMISTSSFFFSLVGPSFHSYRENFPLLSYGPPMQEVLVSLGEAAIPPLMCFEMFTTRSCHLLSVLTAMMMLCLISVLCFKFLAYSVPRKSKPACRKPSFSEENWAEIGEESEVLTSSFDTTKPLLPS